MITVSIQTRQSVALEAWKRKEEGSYEDHNKVDTHVYALLCRMGKGKVQFTKEEAETIIRSGWYQSGAWEEEEIKGGHKTMNWIAEIVRKLKNQINENRH